MKHYLLLSLLLAFAANAQSVTYDDDTMQRGWYDRPWIRYEAEPGLCIAKAAFLDASDDQRDLQSEASNQVAAQLIELEDYVEWTVAEPGDGLTVRFSLPDCAEGTGNKGIVNVYVDDNLLQTITLDSYWAWQYTLGSGNERYPDNLPSDNKFARMRFDEAYVLLNEKVPAGSTLRLVKADDNDLPYTIDFVELEDVPEPLTFEDIEDENKIMYDGTDGWKLMKFINENPGKTIYIPAGTYNSERRWTITAANVKIIGAGMWYTRIFFDEPSDNASTFAWRGIETYQDGITLENLSIDTQNNKRYYNNNSNNQVGKGLMGSWGNGSVVKNVRIDHFECGAWITGAKNLTVTECRFRNNYADGINLCSGCEDCLVERCSFRNNGDDDMASWSSGEWSARCTFQYCTSENNWRASGIGFFGGSNNAARHCVVRDALETGIRAVGDFPGPGFDPNGSTVFSDIAIYHCGCTPGTAGVHGDFWGNRNGAVYMLGSGHYDLENILLEDIIVEDARGDGVQIGCSNGHKINNLQVHSMQIINPGRYGIYFASPSGNGSYSNIEYIDCDDEANNVPSSFVWIEEENSTPSISMDNANILEPSAQIFSLDGKFLGLMSQIGKIDRGIYVVLNFGRSMKIAVP